MLEENLFYSNVNLLKNYINDFKVELIKTDSLNYSNVEVNQIFFLDEDYSNLYTFDGDNVIPIGMNLSITDLQLPTQNLNLGNVRIVNLQDPVNLQDGVTLKYLNTALSSPGLFDLANAKINYGNVSALYSELGHQVNMDIIDEAIYTSIPHPDRLSSANIFYTSNVYDAKLPMGLDIDWYEYYSAGDIIKYTSDDDVTFTINYLS